MKKRDSARDPILPATPLERRILLVRNHKVMLDRDLAEVYGVTTKRMNEQVRRNRERFPADFMFQLTPKEVLSLARSWSQNATLKRGQNIKYLPCAFTEHGAVMLASVLNSPVAVRASIHVVRAFPPARDPRDPSGPRPQTGETGTAIRRPVPGGLRRHPRTDGPAGAAPPADRIPRAGVNNVGGAFRPRLPGARESGPKPPPTPLPTSPSP
jgi:hypothetical protein